MIIQLIQLIQAFCIIVLTFISLAGAPFFFIFFFMLLLKGLQSETVQKLYLYAIIYLFCVLSWIFMTLSL